MNTLKIIIFLTILTLSIISKIHGQDIPLEVKNTFIGNFQQTMSGVSLYQDITSGSFELDVPPCTDGTPSIEHAYFIWQQRWRNNAGSAATPTFDDNFNVTIESNTTFNVEADDTYISFNPSDANRDMHVFTGYADVTTIVNSQIVSGANTFLVEGLNPPEPDESLDENWGVGIIVIYECSEFAEVSMQTAVGSDFFWCGGSETGEYSQINCFEFSQALESDLDATITGMFGGQANASPPFRGGSICYLSGSGPLPTNSGTDTDPSGDVVNDPNTLCADNPTWTASLGTEWDKFEESVTIPSGSTWICLQSHSVADVNTAACGSLAAATYSISYDGNVFETPAINYCETPDCDPVPTATVCVDGSNTITLQCQADVSEVIWYNSGGDQVGTGCALTLANIDIGIGAVGTSECFYYEAMDINDCDMVSCCPVNVTVISCTTPCPDPNCFNITIQQN